MSRVTLSMIAAMSEADQRKVTEADFQEALNAHARSRGWMVLHLRQSAFMSDRTGRMVAVGDDGFPDTVLARAGRVMFWELKRDGKRPTDKQMAWLSATNGAYWWPASARLMLEILE